MLGLLALQAWVGHRASTPGRPWHVTDELRRQPLVYGYLLAATVALTTVLGWIVGRKEDLLEALSVTDPLTGLANRRRLLAAFADELNRSARYGTPLALLLIDLDRLKEINDRRGHAQGDRALQLVAESLRRSCRATDLAARTGGDEFLVLAVNTSAGEALALAHRVCATVRRLGGGGERERENHAAARGDGLHRRGRPRRHHAPHLPVAPRRRRRGALRRQGRGARSRARRTAPRRPGRTPVARRPKVGYIPAVAALTATPDSSS